MRLLAIALGLLATPAIAADQFNLVCKSDQVMTTYRVDLAAREWCWDGCKFGTWRIHDVTSTQIIFKDVRSAGEAVSNFVDRTTGRSHRYNHGRFGSYSSDGICEVAPFSGFPKAKF
jgi:hypothetical protein